MQEIKRALRKQLIAERRAMDIKRKQGCDESIFEQLKPLILKARSVLIYISTEIEVDTRRAIELCFEQDIPVAVPVSGDSELTFYRIQSWSDVAEGRFGILEPVNRDKPFSADTDSLCVVPALCADGEGLRLGYGRGYYDRFLSRFDGRSVILCYSSFRRAVPSEPHDKRADMTIFDKTDFTGGLNG